MLIAASASLADTPVKGDPQRKEKVTEQTVFVTGSLIASLAPGASVDVLIQFTNPNNVLINYTPETDSGLF